MMIRRRFQTKVALVFTALVAAVQVVALAYVVYAVHQNVQTQQAEELRTAARVMRRAIENRSERLLNSSRVLVDDFGFKEAVATGDAPTIRSALINHGRRIGADVSLVTDSEGNLIAGTPVDLAARLPVSRLLGRDAETSGVSAVATVEDRAYQLMIVPVRAPLTIAWACLGFRIDAELAGNVAGLTGVGVTFVSDSVDPAGNVLASSHGKSLATALAERAGDIRPDEPALLDVGKREHLVLTLPLPGTANGSVTAVLNTPLATAMAPYQSLFFRLAALGILAVAATILGAWFLARQVSRPVQRLAQAARRIQAGRYDRPVSIRQSDELGELEAAFGQMQRAISEREARILHQAYHDTLTELPNRTLGHDRLRTALEHARRHDEHVTVVMLDINRFKEINDSLGHEVGDRVLVEVAARLARATRDADTIARLGGDEFVLILDDAEETSAHRVIEKLRHDLEAPVDLGHTEIRIEISAGMAVFPDHGKDENDLLRRADIAMYEAKSAKRTVSVYRAGTDEKHLHQLGLSAELREALENDTLAVYYQPQVRLDGGAVSEAEGLVRWPHEQRGLVPPDEFIGLAERTGHIRVLTAWVLERVIRDVRHWMDRGLHIRVSANLSALDVLDPGLPETVRQLLGEYDVPASHLALEVTESAIMGDADRAIDVLDKLRTLGIRLAIDDFGTGYSSLAQLKRLPVDELKIDKSFILALDADDPDDEDFVIVRSTIELARNMGLEVVAEGVETHSVADRLRGWGCEVAQGYLYARAMPADDFVRWLGVGEIDRGQG